MLWHLKEYFCCTCVILFNKNIFWHNSYKFIIICSIFKWINKVIVQWYWLAPYRYITRFFCKICQFWFKIWQYMSYRFVCVLVLEHLHRPSDTPLLWKHAAGVINIDLIFHISETIFLRILVPVLQFSYEWVLLGRTLISLIVEFCYGPNFTVHNYVLYKMPINVFYHCILYLFDISLSVNCLYH